MIEGRTDSLPLVLCQKTATELGFVKMSKEGNLNETNELKIKEITEMKAEERLQNVLKASARLEICKTTGI